MESAAPNKGLVVLAALAGLAFGISSMPFYLLGVFAPSLVAEFGWSWAEVMGGFAIVSIGMIVTGPIIGTLVDRYGPRIVLLPSTLLFAIAFGLLAMANGQLWQYYATWGVMALVGVGTSPIAWARVINSTFTSRRGLAIGIGLAGGPIFGVIGKPLTAFLIAELGWRGAILTIAAMPIFLAVPLIWFAVRGVSVGPHAETPIQSEGMTLREASARRAFWIIVVTSAVMGAVGGGTSLHLERILSTAGMSAGTIIQITPILGASVLLGRFLSGGALDHVGPSLVAAATALISVAGTFLLTLPANAMVGAIAIACMGAAGGAIYSALSILTVHHFGLRHSGVIFGIFMSITGAAAGLGPLMYAVVFDRSGSYAVPLTLAALACGIVTLAQLVLHFAPAGREKPVLA